MRTAVLVSVPVDRSLKEQAQKGLSPQRDYFALADALDATLITPATRSVGRGSRLTKLTETFKIAWRAFRQRGQYDLIIADVERVGVLLALLFKLSGVKKRLILICHSRLTGHLESRLVKMFRLQTHIDRFLCYNPVVAQKLAVVHKLPARQLPTVRHASDHHFWHPLPPPPEPKLIVSAGLYLRDYDTLVEAVRGLDVSLKVAAFSPWMPAHGDGAGGSALPQNVEFTRCDYQQMRELYASALFVAVPLHDTIIQAGSLVTYEAMAMGKAVVATRSEGQVGLGVVEEGKTGLFVDPGDVQGWRAAIQFMLEKPEEVARMGQRARETVENGLNLDTYIQDVVDIVHSVAAEEAPAQAHQHAVIEK